MVVAPAVDGATADGGPALRPVLRVGVHPKQQLLVVLVAEHLRVLVLEADAHCVTLDVGDLASNLRVMGSSLVSAALCAPHRRPIRQREHLNFFHCSTRGYLIF